MTREVLLPQNDLQAKHKKEHYFEKMRKLYQYNLDAPYFSFNGNIACLSTTGLTKWLVAWPTLKLTVITTYKLVMMVIAAIYAWLKSLFKGYPFRDFKDYYFFFFKGADAQYLDNFNDDTYFGLQRVSGPNPTWIKGLTEEDNVLENFKVDNIVNSFTDQTYDKALAEKRLYLADYSILKVMVDNLKKLPNGRQQYTTNPVALFYRQDNGLLKPLAIKLYATKSTSAKNPIYTPANGQHWKMAKMFVQNADLIVQNGWTHSVRIHYLAGSLVLATYRNFSTNHPLFVLLRPHWQDTLAVNTLVRFYRPTEKGGRIPPFGMILPCQQDTLADFFGTGMKTYSFKEMSFPNDIKNQHLEDPQLFFPYRDDGKLTWEAIHEFVQEYINLYYKQDCDVVEDFELQAWGDEIGGSLAEHKMGIPDFPRQFHTIEEVVETVTNVIFLTTAQHTCVHYSLYQYVAFAPNMPFCLMAPPHTDLQTPIFEKDLSQLMPPLKNVLVQSLGFYLNFLQCNKLGDYKLSQFDSEAREVIKNYQQKLTVISEKIKARNQQRTSDGKEPIFRYDWMDPQHIANSITG